MQLKHSNIATMNNNEQHQPLPIIAQLGVLFLIFGGMFVTLFFLQDSTPAQEQLVASPSNIEQLPAVAATPQKIDSVNLGATAAFVWDINQQRALYSKNANDTLPLASITKLMTTLLTYELFDPKTRASLPLTAILQSGDSGLVAGEEFTTGDLQELALISSSNDAAFALGAAAGSALGNQNPTDQFITGMNIRAEELGLDSMVFKNTTGLDLSITEPGSVGTAKDVSFLMEYIIKNYPELLDSTTQQNTRVYNENGEYHDAFNTNELVGRIPTLLGSKTGYTDLAGGNLTIAFDLGLNRPIVITVLGSTRDGRFDDVEALVKAVQNSVLSETN